MNLQEEQAVMQVIQAETRAFWMKDLPAMAACWVQSPQARIMGWWERGGISITAGWDAISERIGEVMKANPEPNPASANVRRENINVRITADMAWVTFDQYGSDSDEPDMDMPGLSYETRILEKHAGEWKIIYAGWLLKGAE